MKQTVLIPLAAAGVAVAFAVAAGLVWLTRGRAHRLVRLKLLLGGALLALGVGGYGCGSDRVDRDGTVTCYAPPPADYVSIDTKTLRADAGGTVRGQIYRPTVASFHFVLSTIGVPQTEAARGPIEADDGAFDQTTEPFHLHIPVGIRPGQYKLEIYADSGPNATRIGNYTVEIVDG